MSNISLLWPQDKAFYSSKTRKLSDEVINSLDIDGLCGSITQNKEQSNTIKEIITDMCCDEEVIQYRQDIFYDIVHSEEVITTFDDILHRLEELKYLNNMSRMEEVDLWKLFSRFRELDGYVDTLTAVRKSLEALSFHSKGLNHLKDIIAATCESEDFMALSQIVKNLSIEINEIQSIDLGINLDTSLNPVEVTLVSVNKTKFKDTSWFRNFVSQSSGTKLGDLGLLTKIHGLSGDKRHPIMYHLYKDMESLLKPTIKDLSRSLRKYTNVRCDFLVHLIPQLNFYLGCARLLNCMKENDMPVCRPEIARTEERECVVKDIYNINLALHMIKQGQKPRENIVLNQVNFDDNARILILTGPNRGGKTVYTEAIGLMHVLFQAGIFVPGGYAYISPVDTIFSHFPVDEKQTVELGRLGEEVKRLNQIFKEATRFSLVLLNESLASTSFTEGLYIARDIVKALRYLEARALFNTHMHELATYADTINNEVQGNSKVVSLVTGLVEGKRSYRIQPGEPLGKSYAREIAVKNGVSFEQIMETIDKREQFGHLSI